MYVYLVYNNSDRDGCVSVIFDAERKALDFAIKEYYSAPYFQSMDSYSLDKFAREHIIEMKVF